ncbi:MAG TPA: hypothetical protein VGO14_05330 [Solirubrobacteraceae bacterium]|jgi:hypothetical protein|nr:hypothetical protein [Solirubrobacteraceae bacterium]
MGDERGGGGLELAWILWTCVAALLLTFGVAELVRPPHTVSLWLIGGLVSTSCSIIVLALRHRGGCVGDTLDPTMGGGGPGGGGEAVFPASNETRGILADTSLALAQTQLLAQVADDASVDGRATGLIGFNGALFAGTIAIATTELVGDLWLAPVAVLALVTMMLLWGLYDGRGDLAHAPRRMNLGASAGEFYETYGAGDPLDARERLLKDLAQDFEKNAKRITRKRRWLQAATLVLVVGLAVAGLLIAVDRPTKMEPCPPKVPTQSPLASSCQKTEQGSNRSGPVVQSHRLPMATSAT